ncbi:hypothetical protein FDJ33_gp68 [Gordonia phage Brandonk123]|uniref:Uncharacterized protein n=1 Tax=Gordonia phage Brandonk123 TaxID=2079564 RepID=A0A2L0HK90_9CAUD|nr:hypothetical protein FDJ33_gp68 [Gordonia phage Brandonk123]AUX81904.1 hypothetical protein SEA_BRANDONK123_68 [Gordonia phage Brandonk123]
MVSSAEWDDPTRTVVEYCERAARSYGTPPPTVILPSAVYDEAKRRGFDLTGFARNNARG